MMHLTNHIKSVVQAMLSRIGVPRWGIVTSVNPAGPFVKVKYQPEGVESGWLPVKCVAAGAMNIIAMPSPGDQVQVHPDNGDMEHGVVSLAAHSSQKAPPVSTITGKNPQSGEFWINSGTVYLHIANGNIYMGGGNLIVAGSITATGNITAGQGGADQVDMQNHTHQYIPGSGTPTQTAAPLAGS